MAISTPRIALALTIAGGAAPAVTINASGTVSRAVFDGPDAATYSWIVNDTHGKPVAGRTGQIGDTVIIEEWPVQPGFTIAIPSSDTDGAMAVILWLTV